MSSGEPALRLPRAVVFAAVCVVVSAVAHAFAGGGTVSPGVMALGAVGALAVAYPLNGRERGPQMVLAATIGAQALLHELFARSAPAGPAVPFPPVPFPSVPFPPVPVAEIGPTVGGLPPVPAPLAEAGPAGQLDEGMSLAHLALAVTTGWWLYRGERAVWLMLRLWSAAPLGVLRWIRALSAGVFAPPARPVPPSEPGPHVGREVEAAIHRRGPPLRPAPAQG
ncbi:hypothetical protein [Microtetraspora malaysiensis]|uniref:hypothetical protein n=1 Tax=Microtetraspora malaysiensis TaxID=161358 RepID=UPI00082F72FE|nr:hypothetical protein [Microtetraspora malaysiensis]